MTRRLSKKKAHIVYRLKDNSVVAGGSTIAKVGEDQSGLIKWANKQGQLGIDTSKVLDEAGNIGSVAHHMIQCYFAGDEPDFREFSQVEIEGGRMVYDKFLRVWSEHNLTLVANEIPLVSEQNRFGGTLDIVARDTAGRLVLADVKSSSKIRGSHYRQVAGYEDLWNENNEEKIARRVIFRLDKVDPEATDVRWIGSTEKHKKVFMAQVALYQAMKEL